MFYILTDDDMIIKRLDTCPSLAALEKLAHEVYADLYVIEGEHAGITYARPVPPAIKAMAPDRSVEFNMRRTVCDLPF